MKITRTPVPTATLAEFCDKYGCEISLTEDYDESWAARLFGGKIPHAGDRFEITTTGDNEAIALRKMGLEMSRLAYYDSRTASRYSPRREDYMTLWHAPRITGIREAGDWERFEIPQEKA